MNKNGGTHVLIDQRGKSIEMKFG